MKIIRTPQQLAELRRKLKRENDKYGPTLQPLRREMWAQQRPIPGNQRQSVWRSRDFLVQVFEEYQGAIRITVSRTQLADVGVFKDGISWDDLQRLKAECGFGDRTAVELYPPDSGVVNVGAMRHLFVLPEAPAFMWGDQSADKVEASA